MGNMFLIIVYAQRKQIYVKVMNSLTSQSSILQLKEMFATHGLPDINITDNGASFCSKEFEGF